MSKKSEIIGIAEDIMRRFEELGAFEGGAALKAAEMAGVRKGELAAVWASPNCTPWSTGQFMNAVPQEERDAKQQAEREGGLGAVLAAVRKARDSDPTVQYCVVGNHNNGTKCMWGRSNRKDEIGGGRDKAGMASGDTRRGLCV